jgi:hypothetical protein
MFLFTVHGHVHPIRGNGHHGEGPQGSSPCQRAPRVPRVRQKHAKGVGRSRAHVTGVGSFDDVMVLGQGRNYRPRRLSCLRHFRKARVGQKLAFGLKRLTHQHL